MRRPRPRRPTNDLDVETLRCLEDAVLAFAGSVIVISHDRWFLDRVATHVLAFEGDSQARCQRNATHARCSLCFTQRCVSRRRRFCCCAQVIWFAGSYSEYEADRRKRTGVAEPGRVKYRPMPIS
jgi:ATPase subunit of ABC transporter with duplicated ATPase domains